MIKLTPLHPGLFDWLFGALISNKCFIHCPAEDKAKIIIYWSKLQNEHKLDYTGGIIDKTMMYEAVRQMGWHANFIWVK